MMNAARGQLYNMWEFVDMLNSRQRTNAPHHQHLQQKGERWLPNADFYWLPSTRWPHPVVVQKDNERFDVAMSSPQEVNLANDVAPHRDGVLDSGSDIHMADANVPGAHSPRQAMNPVSISSYNGSLQQLNQVMSVDVVLKGMKNGDSNVRFTVDNVIVCPGARLILSGAKMAEQGVKIIITDGNSFMEFPNGQKSPLLNHRAGGMLLIQRETAAVTTDVQIQQPRGTALTRVIMTGVRTPDTE